MPHLQRNSQTLIRFSGLTKRLATFGHHNLAPLNKSPFSRLEEEYMKCVGVRYTLPTIEKHSLGSLCAGNVVRDRKLQSTGSSSASLEKIIGTLTKRQTILQVNFLKKILNFIKLKGLLRMSRVINHLFPFGSAIRPNG